MGKKLASMDVTIRDVTRTFEFDPPTSVQSDDEGEASLELLSEAETTEVQLVSGLSSARVVVRYRYQVEGEVEVDLEDLAGEYEDADDVQMGVERQDFTDVVDAIGQDLSDNIDASDAIIDQVDVTAYDDDGEEVE